MALIYKFLNIFFFDRLLTGRLLNVVERVPMFGVSGFVQIPLRMSNNNSDACLIIQTPPVKHIQHWERTQFTVLHIWQS